MQNKITHTLEVERPKSKNSGKSKPIQYYIDENGCYVCTSHKTNEKGYISLSIDGKHVKLHRFLYTTLVGEIPEGLIIMHKCDNPTCVNVEHYQVGTIRENNLDMHSKKRQGKRTYLTIEQKREVYENKSQLTSQQLCDMYGIGHTTLKEIRKAFREGRLQ